MATYRVTPDGNGWAVKKGNGRIVSNHRKKAPAKRAAKRQANRGDSIVIHRSNGTVQNSKQVM